jgi:hypothetical protein
MSRRRGYKKEVRPGVWRLVVSAGKKPDGTRKQSTSTFLGAERDAERMLTRLLADADAGRLRTPSRATLAEFLSDWLPTVESTLKPSSYAQYSRVVRLELSPRLGALPLVRLSALDIQRYLATRAREGNLGPRYAGAIGRNGAGCSPWRALSTKPVPSRSSAPRRAGRRASWC